MAQETGQEKTHEATPRRKQQAREKGQVAQSRELNTLLMLFSSGVCALLWGPHLVGDIAEMFKHFLSIDRNAIFDPRAMPALFSEAAVSMLFSLAPFLAILTIAALAGPIMIGGLNFSSEAISFKFDKLDPVKGLQRVFAWRGLVELFKALIKFLVIGAVAILFLYQQADAYIGLAHEPLLPAMAHAAHLLMWGFMAIAATLILIAAVDVPFQIWDHNQQLKMTTQELRDESKDSEGDPELRGRIKRMQRELAQRRMMAEVPKADVVVTNPEHYSVALRYDQKKMSAPVVVAKGADLIAMAIRTIAREHNVPILQAPPLARALHHSTELNQEVPAGLYLAVAKVLAYVFQLKRQPNWQNKPQNHKLDDLPIPDDFKVD
jgi:flagellar biosynthetic protein FlhB